MILLDDCEISLNTAFRGTLLAPHSALSLRDPSHAYEGLYYGKSVSVDSHVTVRGIQSPVILGGINVPNTTPCVGQPAEVTVDDSAAPPGSVTRIQGVVGNHHFVSFTGAPGPRTVYAAVFTPDGRADFVHVPVTVQQCAPQPGQASPIAFHSWHSLQGPNVLEFSVHSLEPSLNLETRAVPGATYTWSFGDGQTLTTTSPLVTHDYSAAIKPLAQYNTFDVSVTATTSAGTATSRKRVPIWSLYAKNRDKGIIQPQNTLKTPASGPFAMSLRNDEPSPIAIQQANIELIPCDPNLPARPLQPQPISVTINPGLTGTINISRPSIPSDVCSVGIHLLGSAAAGKVYSDAYTVLKPNPNTVIHVTDPSTVALLNQASSLTKDPNTFDEFELRQLYAQGQISSLPAAAPSGPGGYATLHGSCDTPGAISPEGYLCAPGPGWQYEGPEILNAFNGYFIMDHGCGIVGHLLSAVNQHFSHTSTIVKNRVAVRHSTASEARINQSYNLLPEPLPGGQQLDHNVLQFAFPGTDGTSHVFSIDQMVHHYSLPDPDDASQQWDFNGELSPDPVQCESDTTPVPGLVVRPAPDAPAGLQQAVASVAAHAQDTNGHYRFFSFSRSDELLPGADWASGTVSTQCAMFDRLNAINAGLALHPTAGGGAPDGMREYPWEQRLTAANALHDDVSNMTSAQCSQNILGIVTWGGAILQLPATVTLGPFAPFYCDTAKSNVSNQITNCFASDGCDDTGLTWAYNPTSGIAVSPDDILDWDRWEQGGSYGYNERMVYKPAVYTHSYEWVVPSGSALVTVKVVDTTGQPFPNASVLVDTNVVGSTDATGTLLVGALPGGSYEIGAQFDPCAGQGPTCTAPLEQASIVTTVPSSGNYGVTLTLCAGPVINGIVTSCPQPGTGPGFSVRATATQWGPDICGGGTGFTPNGPVTISYLCDPTNPCVPGKKNGNSIPTVYADAVGNVKFLDIEWETYSDAFCSQDQLDGTTQVTIAALDEVSDIVSLATVPAAYWCSGSLVSTNFNGGCP